MARIIWLLILVAGAVACSDVEPAPSVDLGTPEQRVAEWLTALDALDLGGLGSATDPARVALMAGAENDFTKGQMFAVIDDGLPGPTAQSYWSSFRSSFETFLGTDISEVTVGEVERYRIDDNEFAAVTVSQADASAEVITVLTDAGWRVDLVGTAGGALAPQLTALVTLIVDETTGDDVEPAVRYRSAAIASLRAALELAGENRALQLELDAIESLPRPSN